MTKTVKPENSFAIFYSNKSQSHKKSKQTNKQNKTTRNKITNYKNNVNRMVQKGGKLYNLLFLIFYKNPTKRVGRVQSGPHHHLIPI